MIWLALLKKVEELFAAMSIGGVEETRECMSKRVERDWKNKKKKEEKKEEEEEATNSNVFNQERKGGNEKRQPVHELPWIHCFISSKKKQNMEDRQQVIL